MGEAALARAWFGVADIESITVAMPYSSAVEAVLDVDLTLLVVIPYLWRLPGDEIGRVQTCLLCDGGGAFARVWMGGGVLR